MLNSHLAWDPHSQNSPILGPYPLHTISPLQKQAKGFLFHGGHSVCNGIPLYVIICLPSIFKKFIAFLPVQSLYVEQGPQTSKKLQCCPALDCCHAQALTLVLPSSSGPYFMQFDPYLQALILVMPSSCGNFSKLKKVK